MKRRNEQNDFEVIVSLDDDRVSEHIKVLDNNNVLNRLNNLERDYEYGYNNLVSWVYNEFKSTIPYDNSERVDEISLMSVLKRLPSDRFDVFLNMLEHCEDAVEFNKK